MKGKKKKPDTGLPAIGTPGGGGLPPIAADHRKVEITMDSPPVGTLNPPFPPVLCRTCHYWGGKRESGKVDWTGPCRRYPVITSKSGVSWCGEHRPAVIDQEVTK